MNDGRTQQGAGVPVWRDLDQAALDAAYDQRAYAPNLQQIIGRYASNSERARQRLGHPQRFSYGASAVERLDVYATQRTRAPIQVFIHGGAWRTSTAADYAFPAETFVRAGAHWVVPDFAWVQDVGGSLLPLAEQLRRALTWIYRNASVFDGDADRIYVSGHSSGAHLAGVLLTTDWTGAAYRLPPDLIKGGLCCSGMFDLEPVSLSARRSYVNFTDAAIASLSPQRHIDRLRAPLVLAYGSLETPEFQRQSRDFGAAVRAAGKPVEVLIGRGYNHFEILETLANPYGLLGRAALEQMRLA